MTRNNLPTWAGPTIWVVVGVALMLLAFGLSYLAHHQPVDLSLSGGVTRLSEGLLVRNYNNYAWKDITLTFNNRFICRNAAEIPAHGEQEYSFAEFIGADNAPFDPSTQAPRTLLIAVGDAAGQPRSRTVELMMTHNE